MDIQISTTIGELDLLLEEVALRLAAKLQPMFQQLAAQEQTMSDAITADLQAISDALGQIATNQQTVADDLTTLAGMIQQGGQITPEMQALADSVAQAAVAGAQQAAAVATQADSLVTPPTPPAP
jgi:methyl-accepting chemotaxis protein